MLDEVAIHPDPISWTTVGGLRMRPIEIWEAWQVLIARGYIEPCGQTRKQWTEILYRLTSKGRRAWRERVMGVRKRTPRADPVPKFTQAQLAVAAGPRDVFDLARAGWTWDKRKENLQIGVHR